MRDVRSRRSWPCDGHRLPARRRCATYWSAGARYRAARAAAAVVGAERGAAGGGGARVRPRPSELVRGDRRRSRPISIYGGTTGALAAIAEAARRPRDAVRPRPRRLSQRLKRVGPMRRWSMRSPRASSRPSSAGRRVHDDVERGDRAPRTATRYGVYAGRDPQHLSAAACDARFRACRSGRRCACIGSARRSVPGRGLEDAVAALGRAGVAGELTLRGRAQAGYLEALRQLAATHAPRLSIVHQPPAPPDAMVDLARGYDVGLALEQMDVAQPPAVPDEQGVHLHPRRGGGGDHRHAGAARARRRSRARGGAGAARRRRGAGRGVRALGRRIRRRSTARSGPRGRRRRGAGTGSTSAERGSAATGWSRRRWREGPAA